MAEKIKKKCDKCGKEISLSNFKRHYESCKGVVSGSVHDYKISETEYKCPFCSKISSKYGIKTHIWRCHNEEGKLFIPTGYAQKGRPAWSKGLTKEMDERVRKQSEKIKERYRKGELKGSWTGRKHTEEQKRKISEKMSKNNKGGRCKWFEIIKENGEIVKVQGTWEKRFSVILNIIDKDWIKPSLYHKEHSYKWIDNENKEHTYTPDFYSPKLKKYFEVKGYWWGNDKEKMRLVLEQNKNIKIEVLREKDLKSYEKLYGAFV